MTREDKAKIILQCIDDGAASIPAYMEKYYQKAVMKALQEIERREMGGHDKRTDD